MKVSIAMCSYRRAALLRHTLETIERQSVDFGVEIVVCEDGDDGGATRQVCMDFGAIHLQRKNRPETGYSNPAVPLNIAIRRATGEVLVLQNPECSYEGNDVLRKIVAPHAWDARLAVFAAVRAMNPLGDQWAWYCHPLHSPRPFFFCGSVRREHVIRIEGFCEEFIGYGCDDNFFAFQLQRLGVQFRFLDDAVVRHHWHESAGTIGLNETILLYNAKMQQFSEGRLPIESNGGRDWGNLNS